MGGGKNCGCVARSEEGATVKNTETQMTVLEIIKWLRSKKQESTRLAKAHWSETRKVFCLDEADKFQQVINALSALKHGKRGR